MRTIARLIQLGRSVNAEAIDNDGGSPGEHIAGLCRDMADALENLNKIVEAVKAIPLDTAHEAVDVMNMLVLSSVSGGLREGEGPTDYLRRLMDELVALQRGTKCAANSADTP